MKIVHFSDTHTKHRKISIPDGDVLAFSGDMSYRGYRAEIEDFFKWIDEQSHKYKIIIAGNHDLCFDPERNELGHTPEWLSQIIEGFHVSGRHWYLENEEVIIEGVKFWGSPITPWFYGEHWAFNKVRGEPIKEIWDKIPLDTDVLITHGPPEGILDMTVGGNIAGCRDLLKVIHRVKPKLSLFGHIHEAYGVKEYSNIKFNNGSVLDEGYNIKNRVKTFDI